MQQRNVRQNWHYNDFMSRLLALLRIFCIFTTLNVSAESAKAAFSEKKLSPETARLLAIQANRDYVQGKLPTAEEKYQQAITLDPNNTDYINHLAAIKTRLGKPQEAEPLLRKSLELKLENPSAWLLLGMNALDQQKNNVAFAALVQATLYDPNNARAQNYLGIAAGHKGWNEISEASLRRAIELDHNYADAHFNLAAYYLRHTPPAIELARRHYQRALDLGAAHDPEVDKLMDQPVSKN